MLHHLPTILLALPALYLASCSPGGSASTTGSGGSGGSGGSQVLRHIEIVNTTTATGTAVTEVVVPLRSGDFEDVPHVITGDLDACQAFAMGPRFADGSLRYLRLEVPVAVKSGERRTLELRVSNDAPPVFRRHHAVTGLTGVESRFRVANQTFDFPTPTLLEAGPLTRVYRSRVRATGSMLWAELTVSVYSNLPHAKFVLHWGNSDPTNPELFEDPGEVEFQVSGARVEFENRAKILVEGTNAGVYTALLHRVGALADGQSQVVEGRFVYGDSDSPPRVFALAQGWVAAGTYGPFGQLLPDIAVDPVEFEGLVRDDERSQKDHPWARCVHGCNPDPSNTGYQNDFGTIAMRADVLLVDPRRLPTIIRSVYQEACRATHFRETDVSRVIVANHPKLLTLDGRPKITESKDLLGKKKAWLTWSMKGPSNERWRGHDTEHLSINYLAGLALLTGNRFAREECEHHCMLYLTGFTHNSGSYNDSPGPARKVGRSSLAAIWMWQVTGREDVRQRVRDRADDVLAKLKANAHMNLSVVAPRGSYWVPWEEGMALTGLAAIDFNFGSPAAKEVFFSVSKTVVVNGFGKKDDSWRSGYELPWFLPNGKDYEPRLDPNFPNIAAGNGLTTWCIPALFLAAEFHPDTAIRNGALTIIKDRHGAPVNGLSSTLSWMCVTPNAARLAGMTSSY